MNIIHKILMHACIMSEGQHLKLHKLQLDLQIFQGSRCLKHAHKTHEAPALGAHWTLNLTLLFTWSTGISYKLIPICHLSRALNRLSSLTVKGKLATKVTNLIIGLTWQQNLHWSIATFI